MASQSVVMQRIKGSELITLSSQDVLNQSAHTSSLIAQRAYELFESRGCAPGNDIEDWFRAESEFLHTVPLRVTESNDKYIVSAEVPGFSPRDIRIGVQPRLLAIAGKREAEEEAENTKENQIRSEWCSDRIFRTLELPSDVDPAGAGTTLKDGILIVELPKARTEVRSQLR